MNIFTYGSLMVPSVMAAVTKRQFPYRTAKLPGYARFCIIDEVYPGITEKADAVTDGILYTGLDGESILILDSFEGDYYQRTPVAVSLEENPEKASVIEAQTYVIRPPYRHLLSDQPWDFQVFKEHWQEIFIREYEGFAAARKPDYKF